ncbi:polymer-forming cytoskeletal protein, partial [bacterium]|nr:polymer-forming cytoskeletal protein [bacterium]
GNNVDAALDEIIGDMYSGNGDINHSLQRAYEDGATINLDGTVGSIRINDTNDKDILFVKEKVSSSSPRYAIRSDFDLAGKLPNSTSGSNAISGCIWDNQSSWNKRALGAIGSAIHTVSGGVTYDGYSAVTGSYFTTTSNDTVAGALGSWLDVTVGATTTHLYTGVRGYVDASHRGSSDYYAGYFDGRVRINSYLYVDTIDVSQRTDTVIVDDDLKVVGDLLVTGSIAGSYIGAMDTIWANFTDGKSHTTDTIVAYDQFKVYGELIADSIQAVGNVVEVKDSLRILGDVNVQGDLFADSIYARDDIVAANNLDIGGNANIAGHAVIDDYLTADSVYSSGNVVANNNLYVGGHADIVDYVNTDSIYAGDDVVINATVFVDTITGEDHDTITVTNDFKVNGELIVDSIQAVGNSVEIDDSLIVHGDLTVDGTIYNHNISIDTLFAGDLGTVTDTIYAWDNFFVHGELIADSIQAVGDVVEIDDSLLVHGTVSADSLYTNNGIHVGGSADVANDLTVGRDATITRDLTVNDDATINDHLTVNGISTFNDDVSITGNHNLSVSGDVSANDGTFTGALSAGSASITGAVTADNVATTNQITAGTYLTVGTYLQVGAHLQVASYETVGTYLATGQEIRSHGGISLPIRTVNSNVTLTATDYTVLANGTITITLPAASSYPGKVYVIKNIGTGTVTVSPSSGTIDGASSKTLSSQYYSIMVQSDGSNWYIISEKMTP